MIWVIGLFGVTYLFSVALNHWLGFSGLRNGIILIAFCTIAFSIFHERAKAIVRRAGLPTQKRSEAETVRRTGTETIPIWTDWRCLFDWTLWLFIMLFVVTTISCVFNRSSSLYLSGFLLCIVACLTYFFNSKSPEVRVDERGVLGYDFLIWPCLVPWKKIEQIYVQRTYHPLAGKQSLRLILKKPAEKIYWCWATALLITRQIKRRLGLSLNSNSA